MGCVEFGYIYVASNPYFKDDVYKVGYTGGDVEERLNGLYKTGVPDRFKIEFNLFVPNPSKVEEALHCELNEYRINDSREFFECSLETIYEKLFELVGFMEGAWDYIVFGLEKFWEIAHKSLSEEFISNNYISGFEKEEKIETQIEEHQNLYIKDGQVYYAEVKVCLGNIDNIKKIVNMIEEE